MGHAGAVRHRGIGCVASRRPCESPPARESTRLRPSPEFPGRAARHRAPAVTSITPSSFGSRSIVRSCAAGSSLAVARVTELTWSGCAPPLAVAAALPFGRPVRFDRLFESGDVMVTLFTWENGQAQPRPSVIASYSSGCRSWSDRHSERFLPPGQSGINGQRAQVREHDRRQAREPEQEGSRDNRQVGRRIAAMNGSNLVDVRAWIARSGPSQPRSVRTTPHVSTTAIFLGFKRQ